MGNNKNLTQLTKLSVAILLIYIAFNSASNIQSQLLKDDGFGQMGFYILAVLYFFMAFASLLSTALINKLGTKVCLFIGGLGNVQWILSTILATEQQRRYKDSNDELEPSKGITATLYISTMINGFTLAMLWTAANQYVASCASEANKGFYFSWFWTFYMCSQILGNFIAAYTLGDLNQISFFVIMASIALVGTLLFLILTKPMSQQEQAQRDSYGSVEPPQPQRFDIEEVHSFTEDIKSVFLLIFNRRMRRLLPQLCWTGISIAVYTGLLVPTITFTIRNSDESYQFKMSMLAMVALGFGEIIGAIIQGRVIDKLGSKRTSLCNCVYILIATLGVLNLLYTDRYSLYAYVVTFLWGFQDSAVSVHLNSILGFEFETNKEPFSIDVFFEALFVFTFQVIQSFVITWSAHYTYLSVVGIMGIIMTLCTYFFEFKERATGEEIARLQRNSVKSDQQSSDKQQAF